MCVLMVCFNVLELLLDETAMPRGMEVGTERFMLGVLQLVMRAHWWLLFVCVLGPPPWDGLLFHVRLIGRCSSSCPDTVSFHLICLRVRTHNAIWLSNLWAAFVCSSVKYIFITLLFLTQTLGILWYPQWWVFIVLLSSLASGRAHKTHTSQRYLTVIFYMYLISLSCNQKTSVSCKTFCPFQIIANCVSLLILSSALPVFSRTLGKYAV